ncbi:polysaccharide pyruvyl transferase family protein [Pseudonocardia sp. DSM 110487]|uniref:polysaccharide pyruvyl transferase family protein n=1 Tax=Pseudonocardia sp. DSM 110487 TaxID=2865833 RepID=UPI001C696B5A|nr:polysaccharide pyruvyl transferase family protein [Pseudonocardia sp. DSM 110487]QYN34476.1 polysaccharide pyruvyl transferase family protein [Pseudonocardia sp. DSM 110487]
MTRSGAGLRIVVQNGEYWLSNKGDLAMLDVTLRRLHRQWPAARLGVITSAPLLLRAFAPATEPLTVTGPGAWPRSGLAARLASRLGPGVAGPPSIAWLSARDRVDGLWQRVVRRLGVRLPAASGWVPDAASGATLVLAIGGGYLTDVDAEQVHRTLDLLEHAADRGIPTAMVGQGLGPLDEPVLRERARAVLPRVDLIALREGRTGPGLLAGLGVAAERIVVTGDDAIELGYAARRDEPGSDIGLCLRAAGYSPVARAARASVASTVTTLATETGSTIRPLIISEYRSEDRRSTLPLVAGFPRVTPVLGRYATPHELARRVAHCRVLVTGAYHLAVFALSQGIPVVGLSSSRYYDDKLHGLRDMFGGGLEPIRLDDPDLDKRLGQAVRSAWDRAGELREPLRERAREQIAASRQAYERVFALVERTDPVANRA